MNETKVDIKELERFELSTSFDNLPDDRSIKCYMSCLYVEFGFIVEGSSSLQLMTFIGLMGEMKDFERDIYLKMGRGCGKLKSKDWCEAIYAINLCWKKNDNEHYYLFYDIDYFKRRSLGP